MTYYQTIEYLYSLLPVFHREGKKAYKADLSNTFMLCEKLGNPQNNLKFVHVAGTNGKGSSSHYISSILLQAGYKTGLYTSPHLVDYTERFKIDGKEISKKYIIGFVKKYDSIINEIKPSFFELSVALAFKYFSDKKVDVVVLETGLGGRLDSTNVIQPIVSLITNIGFDHKDILGNTLLEIGFEKAGIIKESTPVVISQKNNFEVDNQFTQIAKAKNSELFFAEEFYKIEKYNETLEMQYFDCLNLVSNMNQKLQTDLLGEYQSKNLVGVLKTIDILSQYIEIPFEAILKGIQNVKSNTGLLGRWQILEKSPLMVTDIAHNEHGLIEILKQTSKHFKTNQIYFVIGFLADKDVISILKLFPKDSNYVFCKPNSLRALDIEKLKSFTKHLKAAFIEDVNEAIVFAKSKASKEDLIYIGGSTFVVSEILNLKNGKKKIN